MREASPPVDRGHAPVELSQCADQTLGADVGERGRRGCETEGGHEFGADVAGQGRGEEGAGHALRDRVGEQSLGGGHDQQRGDGAGAGRLAEDGDPGRVAAERGDLVLYPAQGGHLVEQGTVGRRAVELGVALDADAVVGRHDDHAALRASVAPSKVRVRRPEPIGAAVDPHHDREPGRTEVRGPDVEGEPVGRVVAHDAAGGGAPPAVAVRPGPAAAVGRRHRPHGSRPTSRGRRGPGSGARRPAGRRTGSHGTPPGRPRPCRAPPPLSADHSGCRRYGHGAPGSSAIDEVTTPA